MKYPGGSNPSTFFYEQVSAVTALYEQWNDCERTVVLYALLKRLPFSNLKFLQLSIDYNLTQNYNTEVQKKFQILESNSNNAQYLEKILQIYKELKATLNGCNNTVKLQSTKSSSTASTPTTVINTKQNNNNNNNSNSNNCNNKNSNKDSNILFESAELQDQNIEQFYNSKEDILNDILIHLPLLKPGNDDAKSIYLALVPFAIDDSVRQIVPTESVQQILSYLLIHPAITNEDRRSLSQWLTHLEDHISSSYIINPKSTVTKMQSSTKNCGGVVVGAVAAAAAAVAASTTTVTTITSSNNSTSCSLSSSSSVPSSLSTPSWQTVAPPHTIKNDESPWDLKKIVTKDFCDEVGVAVAGIKMKCQNQTSQSTVTSVVAGGISSPVSYESSNDDHHISFSKNGTEILDYDYDDMINDKSNTQIAIPTLDTIKQFNEFLNVPNYLEMLDANINTTQKTRRSNSLTTTPSSQTSNISYSLLLSNHSCDKNSSNVQYLSSENLAAIQKPRSFSLTIESPRSSLTSSGSDTRLDDFNKQHYLSKFNSSGGNNMHVNFNTNYNNIGMHNIGQWLKSLRLHKYVWLFTNLTYEEMLDMTEDYLQNLGVTKGARHKLVLCIQKLRERLTLLKQIEMDLLNSPSNGVIGSQQFTLSNILEELTNIVLTPMKPIDFVGTGNIKNDDVARTFMKVLDCVCGMVITRTSGSQDEESVNVLLWILEKALHNEVFVVQLSQLKEHKYKLSKMKMQFTPKNHYNKNQNGNGNLNKPRWNSNNSKHTNNNKQSDNQQQPQQPKSHRKNSTNSIPYFSSPTTTVTATPTSSTLGSTNHLLQLQNSYYSTNTNNINYNKSSSYPNFSSSNNSANNTSILNNTNNSNNNSMNSITSSFQLHSQQAQQPSQYHRHSLNNLITLSSSTTTTASPTSCSLSGGPLNSLNLNKLISNNNRENIINRNLFLDDGKNKSNCINLISNAINNESSNNKQNNSIGEINSRLEFLCLQMTEQAIN